MIVTKSVEIGGKLLTIETGRFARQADGAVMARYGDTMILVTAVAAEKAVEGQDFFPLQVEYREKHPRQVNSRGDSSNAKENHPKRKFSVQDKSTDRLDRSSRMNLKMKLK
jgi:hypothetical protein